MGEKQYDKQCWIDDIDCIYRDKECKDCERLLCKYGKVVFCGMEKCVYHKTIPGNEKIIPFGGTKQPLFGDPKFKGICIRSELGIRQRLFEALSYKLDFGECPYYSQWFISGHMDWSQYPKR